MGYQFSNVKMKTGVPFSIAIFWLVLKFSVATSYTLTSSPIQIVDFSPFKRIRSIPRFTLYQKYSKYTNILIPAKNCLNSLALVVLVLKSCSRSTDTLHLAVFIDDNSLHNLDNDLCQCLFSENGSFFPTRGITHSVQNGIQTKARHFCKTIHPKKDYFWTNYSAHSLVVANQFSLKNWQELKKVEQVLLPTRDIRSSARMAADRDIQEFSTSIICLHLSKKCNNKMKTINNTSSITSLLQGNVDVVVYVLPKSNHPWEVELSPAVYFDQLIFTIKKEWMHSENIKFVKSFRSELWAFLSAFIAFVTALLLVLGCIKNKINTENYYSESWSIELVCFSLVVSLLEQPIKIFARHIEVYMLLGFWFLVLTSLTTAYKSKLVENLIKREQILLPSTIDELLNSSQFRISHNLLLGTAQAVTGIGGAKVSAAINRSELVKVGQNQMACLAYTLVDNIACLTLENANKLDATLLSTSLRLANGPLSKIWHFSERSTGIYAMWGYRKGFPLKEKFNDALGRISQAGLLGKWFKTVLSLTKWFRNDDFNISTIFPVNTTKEYGDKLKNYIKRNRSRSPDSELLVMKHIRPVFKLCSIVLCFSILIFMTELIISKCTASKTTRVVKFQKNMVIKVFVVHCYDTTN